MPTDDLREPRNGGILVPGERPVETFAIGCARATCIQDRRELVVTIQLTLPMENPELAKTALGRIAEPVQAWAVARQRRSGWYDLGAGDAD